jgi:ankyrin repeat protein
MHDAIEVAIPQHDGNDYGTIHHAVVHGDLSDVEKILDSQSATINNRNADGDTPLLLACQTGNATVTSLLLSRGADAAISNNKGESPLHWTSNLEPEKMGQLVSILAERGAKQDASAHAHMVRGHFDIYPLVAGTALHRAVSQANIHAVHALLRAGSSAVMPVGPTFFHKGVAQKCDAVQLACMWHEPLILDALLEAVPEYPIQATEERQVSLLYSAIQCQGRHLRMARHGSDYYLRMHETLHVLLRHGSTNIIDHDGRTALQLGVISGSSDVLEYLLSMDIFPADINTVSDGISPLQATIVQENAVLYDLLVHYGASPYQENILAFAAMQGNGNHALIEHILDTHSSVTQVEKDTALAKAIGAGRYETAELLLCKGADINGLISSSIPGTGSTQTILASAVRSPGALELYLSLAGKYKLTPEFLVVPAMRESAFTWAAGDVFRHDDPSQDTLFTMLFVVFPTRSHLELRNGKGWTPLHCAIASRNATAVRKLVHAGADVNSLALFAGFPVGPSPKDMAFAGLFRREAYYNLDLETRLQGDLAMEEIIKTLTSSAHSIKALRSKTLREQRRPSMNAQCRRVSNIVDVLAMLPTTLPKYPNATNINSLVAAMGRGTYDSQKMGSSIEFSGLFRRIQWAGVEKVRHLNQGLLGDLLLRGLYHLYVD